jgi:hypothetical protein
MPSKGTWAAFVFLMLWVVFINWVAAQMGEPRSLWFMQRIGLM